MVINQKINSLQDIEQSCNELKRKNKEANDEIFRLRDANNTLDGEILTLQSQKRDCEIDIAKYKRQIEQQMMELLDKNTEN